MADRSGSYPKLTGFTLLDLLNSHHGNLNENDVALLLLNITGQATRQWISSIQPLLQQFSIQRAVRNLPMPFLPTNNTSPLGVNGLHCTLVSWLEEHRNDKARKSQWVNRINNLTKKGLRSDERCITRFDTLNETFGELFTGNDLLNCLNYSHLRISIVPVIDPTAFQLNFSQVTGSTPIKRLKPKLKNGPLTTPKWRDPMLGYWIDEISWNDLFPGEPKWIAFTHRGEPIISHDRPTGLCENPEIAKSLASSHAKKLLPKFTTKGKWFEYSLTGGEN